MWFRSHQALSVRPLVRHSWISSIHSWSERLGCLWTILVQLLCCVLWVYWTSNTSLWTKLVQCLNSLGLEWLSHELAGMERRWVIQRLHFNNFSFHKCSSPLFSLHITYWALALRQPSVTAYALIYYSPIHVSKVVTSAPAAFAPSATAFAIDSVFPVELQ